MNYLANYGIDNLKENAVIFISSKIGLNHLVVSIILLAI